MRNCKLMAALACAVCLLAVDASGAAAGEFQLPEGQEELTIKGGSGTAGEQEFNLGPFQIGCTSARSTGQATARRIQQLVHFKGCTAHVELGGQSLTLAAKIEQPVAIDYLARENEVPWTLVSGFFEITFKGLACNIAVGYKDGGAGDGRLSVGPSEVSVLEVPSARLKRFPSGLQRELSVAGQAGSIPARFGGACEQLEPTVEGTYSGTLWAGAPGDLGYLEAEWNHLKNEEEV